MSPINLNNFPEHRPYSNVQPFTVRDGATYLLQMEALKDWLRDYVIPHINTEIGGLSTTWIAQTEALIQAFEDLSAANIDAVTAIKNEAEAAQIAAQLAKTAAEAAAALAEQYASEAEDVQDAALATIFANDASATRAVADGLYASANALEAIETALAGRLSEDTLMERFDEKADAVPTAAAIEALETATETLAESVGEKADSSVQATVETGRLSQANIDARFKDATEGVLENRLGGFTGDPKFLPLRAAMIDPLTTDYRVCVLGSSSSNGAYVTQPEKAVFRRLGHRSGAKNYPTLASVGAPVGGTGLRWWTGSEGNTTSANYFPIARRTALQNVGPDLVIHMIGENDFYYGTTINDYVANLEDACSFIESVSPGAINVLIHSHGRNDVTTPVAPWTAYRDALKQVVANKPSQRYFIDAMEYFYPLGTMRADNIGGMLMDTVHPGDLGHKYLAKIIGAHLGIPDPEDYAGVQSWNFPLPGVVTNYTVAGSVVAELWMGATNYPRELALDGAIWNSGTNANAYFQMRVLDTDTSLPLPGSAHAMKMPVAANSMPLVSTFYCPPFIKPRVQIQAFPESGVLTVQPDGGLSRARLVATPV